MDPSALRLGSISTLDAMGWPRPSDACPLLLRDGSDVAVRSPDELRRRVAILSVVLKRMQGWSAPAALVWLVSNDLDEGLTDAERALVEGRAKDEGRFATLAESLWTLLWALGPADNLDPREPCGDALAALLPDVAADESFEAWIARMQWSPLPDSELLEGLDLYFCLAQPPVAAGSPGILLPDVIGQRLSTVDWCLRLDPSRPFAEWQDAEMAR